MALKLPRAIRLDPSDTFVFDRPASPGEWTVSGAFMFAGCDAAKLSAKEKVAFRSGWLGTTSFGWSTLAIVTEITNAEHQLTLDILSRQIHDRFSAPSAEAARHAAEEELEFAASLCNHPVQTLLAVHRTFEDGEIREQFRTISAREDFQKGGFRVFEVYESDEAETPLEHVDLARMAAGTAKGRAT